MKRGTTNPNLRRLINTLRKTKKGIWRAVADNLERPARQRPAVNLSKINHYTQAGDTVVIPGKVLAHGELDHEVTIAAFQTASKLLKAKTKAKLLTIPELLKAKPNGSGVKIIT